MSNTQAEAFEALVSRWVSHEELRATGAPLSDLMQSRLELDQQRWSSRRQLQSV